MTMLDVVRAIPAERRPGNGESGAVLTLSAHWY